MASRSVGKAKIAQRVFEVLEYFNDIRRTATVMDIARYYQRPQSSTSELLSTLVEQGLLHKDPTTRCYMLTPRAALLGTGAQPDPLRDGSLARLTQRLAAQVGLPIAVFGLNDVRIHVLSWQDAVGRTSAEAKTLHAGMLAPLSDSAAGWLLLSTLEERRCAGIISKLKTIASVTPCSTQELAGRLRDCRGTGFVLGPVGFGLSGQLVARPLPQDLLKQPLVLGFVNLADSPANPRALLDHLGDAIHQYIDGSVPSTVGEKLLASAA